MINTFKKYWWIGGILLATVLFIARVYSVDQTVKKHETAFEQLATIAKNLRDPNRWLYDYLINHNIDTTAAKAWSKMPKGALLDTSGVPLLGIPFLNRNRLPESGILQMYSIPDSLMTMSTLWSFPRDSTK